MSEIIYVLLSGLWILGLSLILSEATADGLTRPFSLSPLGKSFCLRGREERLHLYGLTSAVGPTSAVSSQVPREGSADALGEEET